jgi:uncharacterized membrane protein YGL010W
MPTLNEWLHAYGESHQNETNTRVHWICVPAIFWSIVALFYSIKLPESVGVSWNLAMPILVLVVIYYARLSATLWMGMLLFGAGCLALCYLLEQEAGLPLWAIAVGVFVLAWIGQFWGHRVEGKKPSFLKDLQFLLIGPAWLMHFIYQKLGLRY